MCVCSPHRTGALGRRGGEAGDRAGEETGLHRGQDQLAPTHERGRGHHRRSHQDQVHLTSPDLTPPDL